MTQDRPWGLVHRPTGQRRHRYQREYRFAELRRPDTGRPYMYRSDFFIEPDILVEVEGGIWTGGRHTQPKGFIADIEKYNLAP